MIALKRFSLCFTGLLFYLCSSAQSKTITGNVSADATTEPLIGVTVTVKETNQSTVTDSSGNFSITANAGQTLQFSYIGYTNQEVTVGKENTLTVLLHNTGTNT